MKRALPVNEILRTAEKSIQELVTDASKSGDYDEVVLLASIAQTLRDLQSRESLADGAGGKNLGYASSPMTAVNPAVARSGPGGKRTPKKKKGVPSYPRFFRQGDNLVKIGWSKKSRTEYQQKAPFSVLGSLVCALVKAAHDGRIVSMEKVLPIMDEQAGTELLSYQVYLCLALLRDRGLVVQHGRQGYSVGEPSLLESSLKQVWQELPSK
jgi:hypothetical protein